jgi:hypothetical protein
MSIYTTGSTGSDGRNGEQKKDLWSSMLDSVASGKRLPEKNILLLGMLLSTRVREWKTDSPQAARLNRNESS